MFPLVMYPPPSFEAVNCYICGRRRVAVARYRMICLVLVIIKAERSKIDVPRDVRNSKFGKWPVQERMVSTLEWIRQDYNVGVRRSKRPLLAIRTCCKFSMETSRNLIISYKSAIRARLITSHDLVKCLTNEGCHCIWSCPRISCSILERKTSYCLVRFPYRPYTFLRDDFKRSPT